MYVYDSEQVVHFWTRSRTYFGYYVLCYHSACVYPFETGKDRRDFEDDVGRLVPEASESVHDIAAFLALSYWADEDSGDRDFGAYELDRCLKKLIPDTADCLEFLYELATRWADYRLA